MGTLTQFLTDVWNILQGYTALYKTSEVPVGYVYAFLSISIIITSILTWGGLEFKKCLPCFYRFIFF